MLLLMFFLLVFLVAIITAVMLVFFLILAVFSLFVRVLTAPAPLVFFGFLNPLGIFHFCHWRGSRQTACWVNTSYRNGCRRRRWQRRTIPIDVWLRHLLRKLWGCRFRNLHFRSRSEEVQRLEHTSWWRPTQQNKFCYKVLETDFWVLTFSSAAGVMVLWLGALHRPHFHPHCCWETPFWRGPFFLHMTFSQSWIASGKINF